MYFYRTNQRALGQRLVGIANVSFIDTQSTSCIASDAALYLSPIFTGVVAIRFAIAAMPGWFYSWKPGVFKNETFQERNRRTAEIENWTPDIYRPAPSDYRPDVTKKGLARQHKPTGFLPAQSRFTPSDRNCPFPLANAVPQPAPDYEPFSFPLAHMICLPNPRPV